MQSTQAGFQLRYKNCKTSGKERRQTWRIFFSCCSKLFFSKKLKQICIVCLKNVSMNSLCFNSKQVLKSSEEVFFFVSCISRIHPLFFYATNWRKKFDITENFWMLTNSVVLVAYLSALVLNMLLTSSILFNFWCFISTNEPIFIFANMVNDVPGTDDWHCESWHSLFYLQRRSC